MLRRVDYFDDFFSVQVLENGGCHQNFQHIVYQVSVLQCAELAGCESELGFFFELFSSVYFSFLMFGVIGVAPLSSYVSKHSILKNCNVGIPCLLEKLSLVWSTCFVGLSIILDTIIKKFDRRKPFEGTHRTVVCST